MKVIAFTCAVLVMVSMYWLAKPNNESEIAGYKSWTKANETPHEMQSSLAWLCRSLTPEETAHEAKNVHLGPINRDRPERRFVIVYVNSIGEHSLLLEKHPQFPPGSVIVKEKLKFPASTDPELLTVMIKHERGYNPDCGDWEFMVCDGDGKKIQTRGKLANCQSCHVQMKSSDYISRAYLSKERLKSLGVWTSQMGYSGSSGR